MVALILTDMGNNTSSKALLGPPYHLEWARPVVILTMSDLPHTVYHHKGRRV